MGNYIEDTDITTWPDGTTDTVKQRRIDLAEEMVEFLTGQFFYEKSFDIEVNGTGTRRLFLPFEAPIIGVTNLFFGETEIDSDNYDYDENSIYGPTFYRGRNNIRVVGTYGYSSCPKVIVEACIKIVDSENDPQLYQKYFFESESMGREYSYKRADDGGLKSGIPEVDLLIQNFLSRRPIVL